MSEPDGNSAVVESPSLARSVVAEGVGTALLLVAIVGSGIMGERLAGGSVALALLANSLATGAGLVAIILAFGPISGAHLNPAVTLADAWQGGIAPRAVPFYLLAQIVGAFAGVVVVHAMFGEPLVQISHHERNGLSLVTGEFVATFGLLATIWGCVRTRPSAVAFAVGAYVTAAMWCTSSTAFANPAVTFGRCITDTFTGIRPWDSIPFVIAQLVGALAATALFGWLVPSLRSRASNIIVPHPQIEAD